MTSNEKSLRVRQSRARGRYGESRLAKKVNGVVVGRSKAVVTPDGKTIRINCQKPPDVVTSWASFESKYYTRIPKFLDKVMTQAINNAPKGLTPFGVIADRSDRVTYVVMTLKDFVELHVGGKISKL